jgi:hypothetical protein
MSSIISAGTTTGTALSLTSDTSGELQIQTNNGATTAMTLTTGGNVGIGTGSPSVRLDVNESNPVRGIVSRIRNNATSSFTGAQLLFTQNTVADWTIGQPANTNAFAFWSARNSATDGTEVMRIDSSGNVGIGTTSPTTKLQVTVAPSSSADNGMRVTDGTRIIQTNVTGSAYSYIGIGASETMLYSTGNPLNIVSDGQPIKFIAGTAERMRITSSGFVGIGTSTPSQALNINGALQVGGAATLGATASYGLFSVEYPVFRAYVGDGTGYSWAFTKRSGSTNTDLVTITDSGNLLVACTAAPSSTNRGVSIATNGPSGMQIAISNTITSGFAGNIVFINGNGQVGSIDTSGTSTSYVTTSDYRLKENIAPMTGALAKVSALKPVTYTWKSNGEASQGFIAHELQAVVPDAVSGEKDAVDDEGKPKYQGIDTSFLVATLTAAIQELKAELDSVKAELQTLKGA